MKYKILGLHIIHNIIIIKTNFKQLHTSSKLKLALTDLSLNRAGWVKTCYFFQNIENQGYHSFSRFSTY